VPPTPQARDYPRRADETGSAVVRCTARDDGVPVECRILSEDPANRGFGQAALRVVRRARLTRDSVDSAAMDATFTVTIAFPEL
jgi:protein TonB